MPRPILLAGTEFVTPELPDGVTLIHPPQAQPCLRSVRAAVRRALAEPLVGKPLAERVSERDRVLIVFDSPDFPVPPLREDPRGPAIAEIVQTLRDRGLPAERVRLLCASGVGRIYRPGEIATVLGQEPLGTYGLSCHDAEDLDGFADIGSTREGEPIELNAALTGADLVISVALVQTPLNGGYSPLVSGLASARTARAVWSAKNLCEGPNALDPRSGLHKAMQRIGRLLEKKLEIFHVEIALDTRLWSAPIARQAKADGALPRPLQAWSRIPEPLRARASRLFRAEYQPVAVFAGQVEKVHARVLETLNERCYVPVEKQADIVVLGLASVTPHATRSLGNPVLAATSAFGFHLAWHKGGPLFKKEGAVVLLAPLVERFDKPRHLPYQRFYNEVLSATREPREMAERFEALYSGRPEFVSAYRRRNAYHGLHPFFSWYLGWSTLARCKKVFAVGAEKRPAERLGFVPVATVEEALQAAREAVGKAKPTVAVPAMPPAFGVNLR
ncbi:MAG: lactate racemase domain-containing protein [Myxococcales bacterium]